MFKNKMLPRRVDNLLPVTRMRVQGSSNFRNTAKMLSDQSPGLKYQS